MVAAPSWFEAFRAHQIRGDRHNLHWGDTEGNGLVIELPLG